MLLENREIMDMGRVEPDHDVDLDDPVLESYPQNINNNSYIGSVQFSAPLPPPPLNKKAHEAVSFPLEGAVPHFALIVRPKGLSAIPPIPDEYWRSLLFDCMDDPTNGAMTFCFPCITFGQIAEILDHGQTSCARSGFLYGLMWPIIGLSCIYSSTYRLKLRNKYGLGELPARDWITHLFFESCALSQAYRELRLRGMNPTIGWVGNVARLQQQAGTNPPALQTMTANNP